MVVKKTLMRIDRDVSAADFTLGKLYINGDFFCYTCEDAVRDVKIAGETAIPAGKYKVIINFSNRFKKFLPLLLDVPGFSGIRIHAGNTKADTEGCILIGTRRIKGGVGNSRLAMDSFMPLLQEAIKNGEVLLEIS
jgi:hypothetical protein